MTEHTKSQIERFADEKDLSYIPSIITGMQEDDNVFGRLRFKNYFRALRNMSAHRANDLVTQIASEKNRGNIKIVFNTVNEGGPFTFVLDMVQFTVWMFDMYLQTDEERYVIFWYCLMSKLYPTMLESSWRPGVIKEPFVFDSLKYPDKLSLFLALQDFEYKNFGKIKRLSIEDPYYYKLYKDDPQLFWRIAIPDMVYITQYLLNGTIEWANKRNIETFVELYKERGCV